MTSTQTITAGRFRKKPVVIEAVLWTGDNFAEVTQHLRGMGMFAFSGLEIKTLEGTMRAAVGDWIIKGVKGELYPIKDEIFRETYEAVL